MLKIEGEETKGRRERELGFMVEDLIFKNT